MAAQRLVNLYRICAPFFNELMAVKDRVRHLIGTGHHNAKECRYNEWEYYSFYEIKNLSFGYFISNLKEHIQQKQE